MQMILHCASYYNDDVFPQVMGSCFLSFLETQSKLITSVSEIMSPLGAYKELGKGLSDSLSNSVVKEATVGWLAAAQVSE